jgi:DNA-binding IscR family transcriptional regulator
MADQQTEHPVLCEHGEEKRLVKNFQEGKKPRPSYEISHELEIPIRLVNRILHELGTSGLASEVILDEGGVGYEPARDPESMTIKSVIDILDDFGSHGIPVAGRESFHKRCESMRSFDEAVRNSEGNRKLKDL